jgi:hypothetical protein
VVSFRRKHEERVAMSIKYYTHFKLNESGPGIPTEYLGVIELNRALARSDAKAAAAVLAKNFECESRDVSVLHWSRLQ